VITSLAGFELAEPMVSEGAASTGAFRQPPNLRKMRLGAQILHSNLKQKEPYGYTNKAGQLVSAHAYAYIHSFSEGLAAVTRWVKATSTS
jgi:hypothetical protein